MNGIIAGSKKLGSGSYGIIYDIGDNKAFKFFTSTPHNPNTKMDINTIPQFDHDLLSEISCIKSVYENDFNQKFRIFDICDKLPYLGFSMPKYAMDLDSYIRTNQATERIIKDVIYQILLILTQAQYKFIIHRDLKPHNILLNRTGDTFDVAIIDWGLGTFRYSKSVTLVGHDVQTIWYRSPEQFLNIYINNSRLDIWSLGIIILEFISGTIGFLNGMTERDQIQKIFGLFGVPTETSMLHSFYKTLRNYNIATIHNNLFDIDTYFARYHMSIGLANLVKKMLKLNPYERLSPEDALCDPYFSDHINYSRLNIINVIDNYRTLPIDSVYVLIHNKDYVEKRHKYIKLLYEQQARFCMYEMDKYDFLMILKLMDSYLSVNEIDNSKYTLDELFVGAFFIIYENKYHIRINHNNWCSVKSNFKLDIDYNRCQIAGNELLKYVNYNVYFSTFLLYDKLFKLLDFDVVLKYNRYIYICMSRFDIAFKYDKMIYGSIIHLLCNDYDKYPMLNELRTQFPYDNIIFDIIGNTMKKL